MSGQVLRGGEQVDVLRNQARRDVIVGLLHVCILQARLLKGCLLVFGDVHDVEYVNRGSCGRTPAGPSPKVSGHNWRQTVRGGTVFRNVLRSICDSDILFTCACVRVWLAISNPISCRDRICSQVIYFVLSANSGGNSQMKKVAPNPYFSSSGATKVA